MGTKSETKKNLSHYLSCILAVILSVSLVTTQTTLGYAIEAGAQDAAAESQDADNNEATPLTEDEDATAQAQEQIKAKQDATEKNIVSDNVPDGSLQAADEESDLELGEEDAQGHPFEFVYEDNVKTVTVRVTNPSALPAGAQLAVDELTAEADGQAFWQAKEELTGYAKDKNKTVASYTLYDIHFVKDGQEVELSKGDAYVDVAYKEYLPIASTADVEGRQLALVHMDEQPDGSVQPEEVSADFQTEYGAAIKEASFKTSGFSVYALAVLQESPQVDISLEFEDSCGAALSVEGSYGVYLQGNDGASIVMPLVDGTASVNQAYKDGTPAPLDEGDYSVSVVKSKTGVAVSPASTPSDDCDVYGPGEAIAEEFVLFADSSYKVGSGVNGINLLAEEGEDVASEETNKYESNLNYSEDGKSFLKNVKIYDPNDPEKKPLGEGDQMVLGNEYEFEMTFSEVPGLHFDGDAEYLTYRIPSSIRISDELIGPDKAQEIRYNDSVECGKFWFENVQGEDGETYQEMRVEFFDVDKNGNDSDKSFVDIEDLVNFSVVFSGKLDASGNSDGSIDFGNGVNVPVTIVTAGEPSIKKSVTRYDPSTKKAHYEVEVSAVGGALTNVGVIDIPGEGIDKVDLDTIVVKKNGQEISRDDFRVETVTENGKSAPRIYLPDMDAQDVIVISYDASTNASSSDTIQGHAKLYNKAGVVATPYGGDNIVDAWTDSNFEYFPGSLTKWGELEDKDTVKWIVQLGDEFSDAHELTLLDAFLQYEIVLDGEAGITIYGVGDDGKWTSEKVVIKQGNEGFPEVSNRNIAEEERSSFELKLGELLEKYDSEGKLKDYNRLAVEYYTKVKPGEGEYDNYAIVDVNGQQVMKNCKVGVASGEFDIVKTGELVANGTNANGQDMSNSASFKLEVILDGGLAENSFRIEDMLYNADGKTLNFTAADNNPVIDAVYAITDSGNRVDFEEHAEGMPTENTYVLGSNKKYPNFGFEGNFVMGFNTSVADIMGNDGWGASKWLIDEPCRLYIEYHVPLTSKNLVDDETLATHLGNGDYLANAAKVWVNSSHDEDVEYLTQRSSLTKKNTVNDENNRIDYEVMFYAYDYNDRSSFMGKGADLDLKDTYDGNLTLDVSNLKFGIYHALNLTEPAYELRPREGSVKIVENDNGTKTFSVSAEDLLYQGEVSLKDAIDQDAIVLPETEWAGKMPWQFKWSYSMTYTDDYIESQPVNPVPFENTAEVSWGKAENQKNTVTDVAKVQTSLLNKYVPVDEEGNAKFDPKTNIVDYSIELNENALKLSPIEGSTTIEIYDKIPSSLQLLWGEGDDNSVSLEYKDEDGNWKPLDGLTWQKNYIPLNESHVNEGNVPKGQVAITKDDVGKGLLHVTAPDEMALRLNYKCKIVKFGQDVAISNKVEIAGVGTIEDEAENTFNVSKITGTAGTSNNQFSITKTDASSDGGIGTIPDVTFDIYGHADPKVGVPEGVPYGKTFTSGGQTLYYYKTINTNESGSCTVSGVNNYVLTTGNYVLVERVPTGYEYQTTANGTPVNIYTYHYDENAELATESNGEVGNGTVATISNTPEVAGISVKKVWIDGNNADSKRPESIDVTVQKKVGNAEWVDSGYVLELSASNGWQASLNDLPAYEENQKVKYKVEEIVPDGYRSTISSEGGAYTITNTQLTSIKVNKEWNDKDNEDGTRPESIELTLSGSDGSSSTKTVSANEGWTCTFDNLPKYNANGNEITYTVSEKPVAGYVATTPLAEDEDATSTPANDGVLTITNTPSTSVSGKKTWVYDEQALPDSITVNLMRTVEGSDAEPVAVEGESKQVKPDPSGSWTYEFTDLPKYDADGNGYVYSVAEVAVEGFETHADGMNLTNISKETTSIAGTKVWKDGLQDHDAVEVKLLQKVGSPAEGDEAADEDAAEGDEAVVGDVVEIDGASFEVIRTATTNADAAWAFSFNDLPVFDSETGDKIEYKVIDAVSGYTASVENGENGSINLVNTADEASLELKFGKYFFSEKPNNVSFELNEATVEVGEDGAPLSYVIGDTLETVDVPATAFVGMRADVNFSEIKIPVGDAATYWYTVRESSEAPASSNYMYDETVYLVKAAFEPGENGANTLVTTYWSCWGDDNEFYEVDESEELCFYNNELMLMSLSGYGVGFKSAAVEYSPDQETWVDPQVKKELVGATSTEDAPEVMALGDGEFSFQISELSMDGESIQQESVVATGTNDQWGVVNFESAIANADHALTYTEAGNHWYAIREVTTEADKRVGIQYDTKVIYLNVEVTENDGVLSSEVRYLDAIDGNEVDPLFTNRLEEVTLRVQKTSKDDSHDPLQGSVYGLWLANDNGRDVYLGANTSDANGWIVFENINVIEGAKYYFKEEYAPEGHLVDAYRSAMFTIVPDAAYGYKLVYEDDESFNDRDQGGNVDGDVDADKY